MWFWPKKKVEAIPLKPLKKLVYTDFQYDVGVTTALVIFRDGREVHTKFYGWVDQYIFGPYVKGGETTVCKTYVFSSIDTYKNFLNNLVAGQETKIVDDTLNPLYSWIGQVAHLEIVETLPYTITYKVGKLEDDVSSK